MWARSRYSHPAPNMLSCSCSAPSWLGIRSRKIVGPQTSSVTLMFNGGTRNRAAKPCRAVVSLPWCSKVQQHAKPPSFASKGVTQPWLAHGIFCKEPFHTNHAKAERGVALTSFISTLHPLAVSTAGAISDLLAPHLSVSERPSSVF